VAVLFFLVVLIFVLSPGARVFAHTFLNPHYMKIALLGDPSHNITPMWQAFLKNVLLCVVAEPLVLLLALPVALIRNTKSPLLAGPRAALTVYVDFARGVPLI